MLAKFLANSADFGFKQKLLLPTNFDQNLCKYNILCKISWAFKLILWHFS